MNNLTAQQNVINISKKMADSMYEKYNLEGEERSLFEVMQMLNLEGYAETFETFLSMHGFLREIACLLTDPKISGRISHAYFQENGGKLLLAMMDFFDTLANNETCRNI